MRIDQTSGYTGAAAGSTGGGLEASRDQFLKLFVAQLEHQNPLDPQNGADMVAQLAQFSSLEQQVEGNRRLDELITVQDAAAGAGLADLAGRSITADVSSITVDGKLELPRIELTGSPAAHAGEVVIKGPSGEVVRTLPIAAGPPPSVTWDGLDDQGAPIANGAYTLAVNATGSDGNKVTVRPQIRSRVDAVELGPEGARLRLGNLKITPAAVRSIHGPAGDES